MTVPEHARETGQAHSVDYDQGHACAWCGKSTDGGLDCSGPARHLCPLCGASEREPCRDEKGFPMRGIHRVRVEVKATEPPLSKRPPRGADWQRRRAAVARRDGTACHWCGDPDATTLDHVVPIAAGGRHHIDNLRLACEPCNKAKGSQDPSVFSRGDAR